MRRAGALFALIAVLMCALIIADARAHTSYRWCRAHGHHCTRVHRAYRIRCGGWLWISPTPLYVPPAWRWDRRARWWCEANIGTF